MKRILINATHNEEIRVALCKDHHLYDFDLENRTREQKKANIYKGHITRVEPSLEAVFVEYGSARQGFLPLREIAPEYLKGNPRTDNIRDIIKEGDSVIVQVEKEERGNKGAALSTYLSLAGRYLVLMPNNAKAGGISRQISGKVREEMKQIIASLSIPRGMSVIVRTAGLGKGFDDLQNDLNHLLDAWASILEQNRTRPSPCLVHQEAGVVTRAVRDYLRDDIGEVWIDSENAYNEAAHFIASVMPTQMGKLRKYTDYEPLFARFGIERQIETAYQREVRLPSGGSIVIDQTEAMVAIDINSAKSTKGSDVAETAYHTNLEAADEIARQLRLRDMGGLIVIDFIDMADPNHQKEVEKRLIDATRHDRARVQFAEISKFGLMEMSRQRLRPSLEEATGYLCPRCHGNGMIRDLRSLALSIMRQIEQIALKERYGEIQAEVPTEIAAFLLNEKRESLVYLEQDSGVRVTILPHAHLESPNFSLHFNPDGFAPASYERILDAEEQENIDRGYEVNWQTPEPTTPKGANHWDKSDRKLAQKDDKTQEHNIKPKEVAHTPKAVAWLSNLFAPKEQASLAPSLNTNDVASAIEALVNGGAVSLGASGQVALPTPVKKENKKPKAEKVLDKDKANDKSALRQKDETKADKSKDKAIKDQTSKDNGHKENAYKENGKDNQKEATKYPKREATSKREPRAMVERGEVLTLAKVDQLELSKELQDKSEQNKIEQNRVEQNRVEQSKVEQDKSEQSKAEQSKTQLAKAEHAKTAKTQPTGGGQMDLDKVAKAEKSKKSDKPAKATDVVVRVESLGNHKDETGVLHLSLDGSKPKPNVLNELFALADEAIDTVLASLDRLFESTKPNLTPSVPDESRLISQATKADDPSINSGADCSVNNAKSIISASNDQPSLALDEQNSQDGQLSQDDENNSPKAQLHTSHKQACVLPRLNHSIYSQSLPAKPVPKPDFVKLSTMATATKRATNDPRVVIDASVATLTGTAGELIYAQLDNAKQRLEQDGFVACFLQALGAYNNKTTATNFANYGYPALSAETMTAFYDNIENKGEFATTQGKTSTPAPVIGMRASNDPRGDYVAIEQVAQMDEPILDDKPILADEAVLDKVVQDLDNVPNQKLGTKEPIALEPSPIQALSQVIVEDVQTVKAELGQMAEHALDGVIETVETLMAQGKTLFADNEPVVPKLDEVKGENDLRNPSENYKNMIENIAVQLLPQTGLLNLANPKKAKKTSSKKPTKVAIKVPKADSKPKTEIRKRKPKSDEGQVNDHQNGQNTPSNPNNESVE